MLILHQNLKFNFFKNLKPYIAISIFTLCLLNFTGCATVGRREALPTFNLKGTAYVSLISLCESEGIDFDYDTFTRSATLRKGAHKISLMVGDTLVLVDASPRYLKQPVDIYQGTVVVPYKFKNEILDTLSAAPLPRIKKIVIDAGHGGNDPGAIGKSGLKEKTVVLDIAKRINSLLESEGIEVVMTRSSDKFIPLAGRVEIANNSGADIFLSIHANSNRVRSLNGFEVYYISPYADDAGRAFSAAQKVTPLAQSGCTSQDSLNLKAILWDMILTYDRAESIGLGYSICKAIERNLKIKILGVKAARFHVLKGARMPALLIETGFLSNYDEERMLKNSYYRQKIAEAIRQGVLDYTSDFTLAQAQGER